MGAASFLFAEETRVTEIGPYSLTVTVERLAPRRTYVLARVVIAVPKEKIWAVLTDYDRLAEFIPDLKISKVLERKGDRLVLYQEARIRLPFYRRVIRTVFQVQEISNTQLLFKAVEGDFVWNQGYWYLESIEGETRITYETTVEPNFWIPEWVFRELERSSLKKHFRAILKRCEAP